MDTTKFCRKTQVTTSQTLLRGRGREHQTASIGVKAAFIGLDRVGGMAGISSMIGKWEIKLLLITIGQLLSFFFLLFFFKENKIYV